MTMRYLRQHRKVRIWWTDWWAAQYVHLPEFSFGVRLEPRRPLLVFFVGPLTVALGRHPVLQYNAKYSDIGFVHADGGEVMVREYGRPLTADEARVF